VLGLELEWTREVVKVRERRGHCNELLRMERRREGEGGILEVDMLELS
jgi:hypothetical protein